MRDSTRLWRNDVVAVEDLPAVDAAPFEALERRYLVQQRVLWCAWMEMASDAANAAISARWP